MRLLIVEDDRLISDALVSRFQQQGHGVDCAYDGVSAYQLSHQIEFDLIILDLNLPKLSGEHVAKKIRRQSKAPILVLTARDSIEDRIQLLDIGADDYLTKPFDFGELEARCRAILRRQHGEAQNIIEFADIKFDRAQCRVFIKNQEIELKQREFRLLEILLGHLNRVMSKEELLEHLYGYHQTPNLNTIETYIGRLRKALVHSQVEIKTLRGLGYILKNKEVE